jgi:hypothetical protein
LRFERVDNLGAYSIRSDTGLLIPSDYNSYLQERFEWASNAIMRDAESATLGTSPQIAFVAGIQFVVSAFVWVPSAITLYDDAIIYHRYSAAAAAPHALIRLQTHSHQYYAVLIGVPLCLSLLGVVTGRGLLRMRNWARRATLYMATVPVCGCILFLRLYKPKPIAEGAIFVVGDLLPAIACALLVVLLPVSVWWWILFTRKTVRSRFLQRRPRRSLRLLA